MAQKQLIHFFSVMLKHYFDFDFAVISNAYLNILLLPLLLKCILSWLTYEFQDGLLTVKEDINKLRSLIGDALSSANNNYFVEHFLRRSK